MNKFARNMLLCLTAFAFCSPLSSVLAEELKPGTVIDANNLQKLKNDTFEGHKISDLIFERMQYLILNEGMQVKLRNSAEVPIDPRLKEASLKNANKIKYDSSTNMVSGWEVGAPFPKITEDDPYAAHKLIWNHHYGAPHPNWQSYPEFTFLLIDENRGLERKQVWTWQRYFSKGRIGGPSVEGDGTVLTKVMMFALYPRDIKGLGTYTLRYDNPKMEESWAYLKAVRRVRRLPNGSWMDPLGGTDMLNDDQEIFNAHPTWYKGYKLIGKKYVLAVAHGQKPTSNPQAAGTPGEYPLVDLSKKPYWNSLDEYEPRLVWIVEATPPEEHPYSKKVLYIDAEHWDIYMCEAYDKKGEFWKWLQFNKQDKVADDGAHYLISSMGHIIDYKKRHATIFVSDPNYKYINASDPNAVTIGKLEAAGR